MWGELETNYPFQGVSLTDEQVALAIEKIPVSAGGGHPVFRPGARFFSLRADSPKEDEPQKRKFKTADFAETREGFAAGQWTRPPAFHGLRELSKEVFPAKPD